MNEPLQALSSPIVAAIIRTAFGAYVIYMSRCIYACPKSCFRKSEPGFPDTPWFRGGTFAASLASVYGVDASLSPQP